MRIRSTNSQAPVEETQELDAKVEAILQQQKEMIDLLKGELKELVRVNNDLMLGLKPLADMLQGKSKTQMLQVGMQVLTSKAKIQELEAALSGPLQNSLPVIKEKVEKWHPYFFSEASSPTDSSSG